MSTGKSSGEAVTVESSSEYMSLIRSKYDYLSDREKLVAEFFLASRDNIKLNVREISQRTGTSPATISRFCKSLGFEGFSELRFYVLNGILAPINGDIQIGKTDSISTLKQKIIEFSKQSFISTLMHVSDDQLEKAIEAVEKCGKMIICGIGTASGVVQSATNTFMILGKPCFCVTDPLILLRSASFLGAGDLILGVTTCGYIKPICDALAVAKEHGATTISVTAVNDSLVTKYSDITLNCMYKDAGNPMDALSIAMCQIATLQILQMGFLARGGKKTAKIIQESRNIAEMERYQVDTKNIEKRRVGFGNSDKQ